MALREYKALRNVIFDTKLFGHKCTLSALLHLLNKCPRKIWEKGEIQLSLNDWIIHHFMEHNNYKFCTKCGAKLTMESKFCPQCGNPCPDTKPSDLPQAPEPVTGQESNSSIRQNPSLTPGQTAGPTPEQKPDRAPEQSPDPNALMAQIIGKNTQYYLSQFHTIKASGKGKMNWASFFFTIIHAAYRNVWKDWLKAVYIPLIAEAVCVFAGGIFLNLFFNTFSVGSLITAIILFVLVLSGCGLWFFIASVRFSLRFNSIYLKHVEEKIAKNDLQSDISGVRALLTILAYSAAVSLLLSLALAPIQTAFLPAESYEDYNFYEDNPYGNYDYYGSYGQADNYSFSNNYSVSDNYGFSDSYNTAENSVPGSQEAENIQNPSLPDASEDAVPSAETQAAYEETAAPSATPLFGTYESSLNDLGNAELQIEYLSGDDMIWASFSGASGMDAGSVTGYLYESSGQVYDFYADGELSASMRLSYDGYGVLTVASMDGNTFGGLNFPGFAGTYTQTAAYELP